MNHRDPLKVIFDDAGIDYTEEVSPRGYVIRVSEGHGPKNKGYVMFFTEFVFDPDNQLIEVGSWE